MTNPYKHKPRRRHRGSWRKPFYRSDQFIRAQRVDHKLRRLHAQAGEHESREEVSSQGEDSDVEKGKEDR